MRTILSVTARIPLFSTILACRLPGCQLIDIDEDKEIIFGDELTIDHIVWMGTQPTLHEKASAVGISETRPFADIVGYLPKAVQKGQTIHYLPLIVPSIS